MDFIENRSPAELLEIVENTKDKEVLRYIADKFEVSFSGNTGIGTLKEKLIPVLKAKADSEPAVDENDPIMKALINKPKPKSKSGKSTSILDLPRTRLAELDPHLPQFSDVEKRAIVRAKAMRLHRVKIHNLDPADSALEGAIKTVFNKFVGKVSKYIPFGDENEYGYHVPEILLNSLKEEKYTMRKEVKQRGQVSGFGVKQYKTVLMPKFNIEYLDSLTDSEIAGLAQDQKARGAIDTAA